MRRHKKAEQASLVGDLYQVLDGRYRKWSDGRGSFVLIRKQSHAVQRHLVDRLRKLVVSLMENSAEVEHILTQSQSDVPFVTFNGVYQHVGEDGRGKSQHFATDQESHAAVVLVAVDLFSTGNGR